MLQGGKITRKSYDPARTVPSNGNWLRNCGTRGGYIVRDMCDSELREYKNITTYSWYNMCLFLYGSYDWDILLNSVLSFLFIIFLRLLFWNLGKFSIYMLVFYFDMTNPLGI